MPRSALFPVVLPRGVDPLDGWQTEVPFETQVGNNDLRHKIDGAFVEVPLALTFNFLSDATVGNRVALVLAQDADGRVVYQVPAPSLQPAVQLVSYVALYQLSAQGSGSAASQLLVLPELALVPGWTFRIVVSGAGPGDAFSQVTLTVVRFSTERVDPAEKAAAEAALVPTPLVL